MEVYDWQAAQNKLMDLLYAMLDSKLKASDPDALEVMRRAYEITDKEGKIVPNIYISSGRVANLLEASTFFNPQVEDRQYFTSLISLAIDYGDTETLAKIFTSFCSEDYGPAHLTMKECLPDSYTPEACFMDIFRHLMTDDGYAEFWDRFFVEKFLSDVEAQLGIKVVFPGNTSDTSSATAESE